MRNGKEKLNVLGSDYQSKPAMGKAKATPIDLTILVIPLAALLSSDDTTIETYVWRAGTSICEMQKRPIINKTAILLSVVKAMATKNTLEGRWVTIIVAIAPILPTNLEDSIPLMPPTMLQIKRTPPMESME